MLCTTLAAAWLLCAAADLAIPAKLAAVAFAMLGWGAAVTPARAFHRPASGLLRVLVGSMSMLALGSFVLVELHTGGLRASFVTVSALVGVVHARRATAGRADIAGACRLAGRAARAAWVADSRSAALAAGVAMALAVAAALVSRPGDPDLHGFFGAISPLWYAAVASCVLSYARARGAASSALSGMAFLVTFMLVPALVYPMARYPYTAKHVGVVSFIATHQSVKPGLDIYQAWPAFFSAVAWVCRGVGQHDPLVLARWWPPLLDGCCALALAVAAGSLVASPRRVLTAVVLFLLGNSIGQDYFSPQSFALLLALAVFALSMEPLSTTKAYHYCYLGLLSLALAFSHQITPYLVAAALCALVAFRIVRPVWLPLLPAVPAAGWALYNLSEVEKYFNPSSVGNLGANVATTGGLGGGGKDAIQLFSQYSLAGGLAVVGVVFLVAMAQRRDKVQLALATCALTSLSLVVASSYGNEGIFRVGLFALPWLALGASRLEGQRLVGSVTTSALRAPLAATLALTYGAADLLLDSIQAIRPGQVAAERIFERATPGSMLVQIGSYGPPKRLTPAYADYSYLLYPSVRAVGPGEFIEEVLPQLLEGRGRPIFVELSRPAEYFGVLDGYYSDAEYGAYRASMAADRQMQQVYASKDAVLYLYRPSVGSP